jgi:transposase
MNFERGHLSYGTSHLLAYKPFQNWDCPRSTVGMSRHEITAEQWVIIEPLIPKQRAGPGRKRNHDRQTLNGILVVLKTGCAWQDVPRVYGSPATCWRRFCAWSQEGTWERMWRALLSQLDAQGTLEWAQAFLDGSVVPAKKGEPAAGGGRAGKARKS